MNFQWLFDGILLFKKITKLGTKIAEYKEVLSLPLARTPESQLDAGQSSTGRHWNSPKKDTPHRKTKEKPQ